VKQPHQLLVNQLDASQTRSLQQLDLRLDEQVERDFRNEETRPRSSRVSDGCPDVLSREVVGWVDALESPSEDVVEDVVDSSSSTEFLGGDVKRGSVDGGDEVSGWRKRRVGGRETSRDASESSFEERRKEKRTERSCSSG